MLISHLTPPLLISLLLYLNNNNILEGKIRLQIEKKKFLLYKFFCQKTTITSSKLKGKQNKNNEKNPTL